VTDLRSGWTQRTPSRRGLVLAGVVLAVVTAAVYLPVTRAEFVTADDEEYITANRHVVLWEGWENVVWAFTSIEKSHWHPLTWLSHMLDAQLFGPRAGLHHLTSLLLHIANSVLLLLVLARMTQAFWPSALVAALFALHPLRVESVAWVSERKDVLSTFFFMLTLLAYVHYVRRPGVGRYAVVFLLLALGLLSKPMLVTAPFVLLLLDYWPLGRLTGNFGFRIPDFGLKKTGIWRTAARLALEKLPLLPLLLGSCFITIVAMQSCDMVVGMGALPLSWRVANVAVSYVAYIGKMFWPMDLTLYYPYRADMPWWQPLGAGLLLGVITAAVLWQIRRRPYLAFGWFWYLGTLVPVIGIVQVGPQAMTDRYSYVPSIGLFIMIVWGVADLTRAWPWRRWALPAAASVVLAACMALSSEQVKYWHNTETLFLHNRDVVGESAMVHNNLGWFYGRTNRLPEAVDELRKVLALDPENAAVHSMLGWDLYVLGDLDKAFIHCRRAVEIAPDMGSAHNNLGLVLAKQATRVADPALRTGLLTRAVGEYREAIRLGIISAEGYAHLAGALGQLGRWDEAIVAHQDEIGLRSGYPPAHYNFGMTLDRSGRTDEAADEFREAVRLSPGYALAHLRLGQALVSQHQPVAAAQEFQAALQLDPKLEEARAGLARLKGGP
jgi:protein O-mannosyl-transferase